jgi:hypothetical protein
MIGVSGTVDLCIYLVITKVLIVFNRLVRIKAPSLELKPN